MMNPYPGLRYFEEADQDVFFGREEEIDQLLHRLAARRLVAVLRVSGCGKSSLIRAGLIPVLQSGLADPVSGSWRILKVFPGTAPLEALNRALGIRLDSRPHALREWAGLQNPSEKILLLVDQFEEIFAYRTDTLPRDGGNAAALFVDLLLTATQDPGVSLYIVLTMRTDYLGDCAVFRGLAEALNDGHYLVPRLTRLHLQDAIQRPAEFCRVTPQPALVQRLLTDSAADSDKLPVLQHLLKRLWEERDSGPLELALYEDKRVGGWNHALERDAEAVLLQFPEEQEGVRRFFQALTEPGTGDKPVRRKQSVAELSAVTGVAVGRVQTIIDCFARRDFLRLEGASPNVVVDLMHESVMWQWPKLKNWIAEEAAEASRLRFCREATQKQLPLTGITLEEAQLLRARIESSPQWVARYLPNPVETQQTLDWIKESERRQRNEIEALRRSRRILQYALGAVVLASVLVMIISFMGKTIYRARQEANRAKQEANRAAQEASRAAQEASRAKQETNLAAQGANRAKQEAKKLFDENIFTDSATGRMWTTTNNSEEVNWPGAEEYCRNLTLAGLSGWELPWIDELARLYDPKSSSHYKIRKPFRLTGYWVWSSTKKDKAAFASAWCFDFVGGVRFVCTMDYEDEGRALCVRRSGE